MRWLLHTPGLQRLVGGSTALLTFRGRHSGRLYTTPVSYARDGDRLLLTGHVSRQWWRNLVEHPNVYIRLSGVERDGRARLLRGEEAFEAYLAYLRALPGAARAAGVALRDGEPDHTRARAALEHTTVVAVDLVAADAGRRPLTTA